jgi:hypothetical protein
VGALGPKVDAPNASIVQHYEAIEEKNNNGKKNGKGAEEAACRFAVTEAVGNRGGKHSIATWAFPGPRPG